MSPGPCTAPGAGVRGARGLSTVTATLAPPCHLPCDPSQEGADKGPEGSPRRVCVAGGRPGTPGFFLYSLVFLGQPLMSSH